MGEDRTTWFSPVALTDEQLASVQKCREAFIELYKVLNAEIGEGRRQAIVYTHLEEAATMATKAISHG